MKGWRTITVGDRSLTYRGRRGAERARAEQLQRAAGLYEGTGPNRFHRAFCFETCVSGLDTAPLLGVADTPTRKYAPANEEDAAALHAAIATLTDEYSSEFVGG